METLIKIEKTEENGILVFEFTGELDETNADKTFKDIYTQIWSFENKKLLFKLTGLKYLNSKSIGYIADVFSNIEENESQMYISNCTDWVKDILDLVWITQIIPTVENAPEAIAAMSN